MKCSTHDIEANGVCAYCGRAVCARCGSPTKGQRIACSPACAVALAKAEAVVELILNKNVQGARAGAILCYVLGAIFLASAVVSGIFMPVAFLILFLGASGIGMTVGGIIYGRVAKKQAVPPTA